MHNPANNLPPPLMKCNSFDECSCKVRNKQLSEHDNLVAIKDELSSSIQDELEDNQEDYSSFTHEY